MSRSTQFRDTRIYAAVRESADKHVFAERFTFVTETKMNYLCATTISHNFTTLANTHGIKKGELFKEGLNFAEAALDQAVPLLNEAIKDHRSGNRLRDAGDCDDAFPNAALCMGPYMEVCTFLSPLLTLDSIR
jgi:hypothetical protein